MAIFEGSAVAIVTPFTTEGAVNYPKLEELINFQINGGTDCIVICGTTGESSTLTHEEHIEAIRFTVEKVNKRVPVVAGTGSNSTDTAIWLSEEAEKAGADALLLVTPYYNKATQKGLKAHFTAIAKAVSLPIILYNVPSRTGLNIAAQTAADLYKEVENIVAIKEASGNLSQIAELMYLTDGKIDLYSGNDDQILPIMSLGGKGVISVLANILPRETHDIVANYLNGNLKASVDLQLQMIPVIQAIFCEVSPIPVKEAMNQMGMNAGPTRMPLTEMEPANKERLTAALKKAGVHIA